LVDFLSYDAVDPDGFGSALSGGMTNVIVALQAFSPL